MANDIVPVQAPPVVDSAAKVASSVDDLGQFENIEYRNITIEGKPFRIGSLSSFDVTEWSEANVSAKRTAGLRLIMKSLVTEEPENRRYAIDLSFLPKFQKMRHKVMEAFLKEIIDLNGMEVGKTGLTRAEEEAKKG